MSEITNEQIADYLEGKVELKDLAEFPPEYVEQLRGRAQYFVEGGHLERALMMLEMLEELDRADPLPGLLAVETLLKMGYSDAAEKKLAQMERRHPHEPDIKVARAELFVQIGHLVPAADLLSAVIERDPEAETDAGKRAHALAQKANAMFEELG